jgi:hypothetical protein
LNRADTTGQRSVSAASYKDLRADLKRTQDQLGWIPQHRPAATVQADIEGSKSSRWWGWTESCTKISGAQASSFCQKHQSLNAELASAQKAEKLSAEIAAINAKLDVAKQATVMSEADPQAAVLAKLVSLVAPGTSVEHVQTAMTIMVAMLLEIGSGFGMYVAFSSWRLYDRQAPRVPMAASVPQPVATPVTPAPVVGSKESATPAKARLGGANDNRVAPRQLTAPETDVERFHKERIEAQDGTSLTATTLYEDYCAWCEEQNKEPLALPTFGREFGDLGVQKAKIAGRVRYIGIGLKSGLADEEDKKLPATVAA